MLILALKSAVVVMLAWVAAWGLRRRSAASRHLVWTATAGALVALPVLSVLVPEWKVTSPVAVDTGVVFRVFSVAGMPAEAPRPTDVRQVAVPRGPGGPPHLNARAAVAAIWGAGAMIRL